VSDSTPWNRNCPVPVTADAQHISLAHGEGARLSRRLISEIILPRFSTAVDGGFSDAACVATESCRLAICTDSHTVSPMFFPGGDLGSLSVYGTVNDLAVAGAHPRWLTLSLIIEEGLPLVVLEKILDSAALAARECGVTIVAGDTKVVPRGAADGLFINTSGVGELLDPVPPGPRSIQVGDKVLVSGPIGRHGIAVMSARDGFAFEPAPKSDSRSVIPQVAALRKSVGEHLRTIRDATRGGVSAVLYEWAQECGHTFALTEFSVPVTEDVRGACELLGLDPLYVANEGTIVVAIDPGFADVATTALRQVPGCEQAAIIGEVRQKGISPVTIRRTFGSPQPLDEPSGAPLPRIC
jgi:hydrogenase expression/formation protein HypE